MSGPKSETTASPDEIWVEEVTWSRLHEDEDHLLWVCRKLSKDTPMSVRYVRAKDQTP